jgi:2-iminoacetate synthase
MVERVLQKQNLSCTDLLVLCSDAADTCLEGMAQKAEAVTRRHFGSAIALFTPLYIANYCQNSCPYCSFAQQVPIRRRQLTGDEIHAEAAAIAASGIRHVLVLTGEAPDRTTFSYIKESCAIIAQYFAAVGIEMYPLTEDQYGELIESGSVDSLTIYQETYNEQVYRELHRKGPKKDFCFRLETTDRACRRHIRAVTIGALFGLDDFRREVYHIARHLLYLQRTYPEVELAVSFPRIRPLAAEFVPRFPVTDRQLVRIITAFRLMFPTAGITLSTRESAPFRDGVMSLGITKVSAGVSTAVGGHSETPSATQFEIADFRTVETMKIDLLKNGFQPVTHDWNMKMSASGH